MSDLSLAIADLNEEKALKLVGMMLEEVDPVKILEICREGMRIVITLKKSSNPDIVINQLYKHSRLENTYGVRLLALVNNVPRTLNLKRIIELFIEHRVYGNEIFTNIIDKLAGDELNGGKGV